MSAQGFGIMDTLKVFIFQDGGHAAQHGFNYPKEVVTPLEVETVVVIRNGTVNGNPTVDFLMEDQDGRQFVVMMTANLLRGIPGVGSGFTEDGS